MKSRIATAMIVATATPPTWLTGSTAASGLAIFPANCSAWRSTTAISTTGTRNIRPPTRVDFRNDLIGFTGAPLAVKFQSTLRLPTVPREARP